MVLCMRWNSLGLWLLSEERGIPILTYGSGLIGSCGIWLCSCIGREYDPFLHTCGRPCALKKGGMDKGNYVQPWRYEDAYSQTLFRHEGRI
jgi:hypothetical protein